MYRLTTRGRAVRWSRWPVMVVVVLVAVDDDTEALVSRAHTHTHKKIDGNKNVTRFIL